MANISWAAAVSGDFTDAADWAGGVVPGAADTAALSADGGTPYTVALFATDPNQTVNGVQIAANATLAIVDSAFNYGAPTLTFTATQGGANLGVIEVAGRAALTIGGTMVNAGTIVGVPITGSPDSRGVNSAPQFVFPETLFPTLNLVGNTVLTGGGTIANFASVQTDHAANVVTNVNETVSNVDALDIAVVNDVAGVLFNDNLQYGLTNYGNVEGGSAYGISGGMVTGAVVNRGTITNNEFDGPLTNFGVIDACGTGGPGIQINYGTIENTFINSITNDGIIVGGSVNSDLAAYWTNNKGGLVANAQSTSSFHNYGTFAAIDGTTLTPSSLLTGTITGVTIDNGASGIVLADGGFIDLASGTLEGGELETGDGGAVTLGGSIHSRIVTGDYIPGSTQPEILTGAIYVIAGGMVNLLGSLVNSGTLLTGSSVTLGVGATPVTLTGQGAVILGGGAGDEITGVNPGAVFTNVDNTISGGGLIGGGNGFLSLINQSAGIIVGDDATTLTLDTQGVSIVNAGEIANTGTGGTIIESALYNTGDLVADGGTLTLAGAVTGAGIGAIFAGTLYAAATFNENVAFGGAGTLELARSRSYAGAISGFSTTGADTLDLRDIAFGGATSASFAGTAASGVLTVTYGAHTARITLIGDYLGSAFKVSKDGHDGTLVVDPKAAAQVHSFTAAMAGLALSPAAASPASHAPPQSEASWLTGPKAPWT
jgi:hypothetical protein